MRSFDPTSDPGPLSCIVGQNKTTSGTDGYTYFAYDSLGRKTLQDATIQHIAVDISNSNVVDYYDEDHSHWQRTSDAFGRLTKVLKNTIRPARGPSPLKRTTPTISSIT